MFQPFYGMNRNPFEQDLPVKDAYLTTDMKEMKGRLEHLEKHPGIAVFTGTAGQGKTFSLRCFAEKRNPNLTKFYYICLSTVTTTEFYRQMCAVLGIETSIHKASMFRSIQEFFENMSTNKHIHCMICLDEAQYLNPDILRDLKMLCNFNMDSRNCFSLLLLGQPALINILMRQTNEALRQRIVIHYRFHGITEKEAGEYIRNRLELAGVPGAFIDDNAIVAAYGACSESIRKLNLIITKAFMIGAQNGKPNIDTDIILSAINEIELG